MVQIYLNMDALLARHISIGSETIQAFIRGFNQAPSSPLFSIVDIGPDGETPFCKAMAMFRLFAENSHCKRLFFGCCHNCAYATSLRYYSGKPITLLESSEGDPTSPLFKALPFETIGFTQTFHLAASSDRSSHPASSVDYAKSNPMPNNGNIEGIAKWQEAANDHIGSPQNIHRSSASPHRKRRTIILNVNDERVDSPPQKEDPESKKLMLKRIAEKKYCTFYHLLDTCLTDRTGKVCKYRHGPRLNSHELAILKNFSRRLPCTIGPTCRNTHCIFGHTCEKQPGCPFGEGCNLARFHDIDKTAVRVWR